MASRASLFPDDTDRERMLDMDRRLQPVRRWSILVLAVALIACGPWLGFWTLVPLAIAASFFSLADSRMEVSEHPEYGIFAAWAASEVIIAIAVALAGGPTIPTMSWFAIPIVTLSARFSHRGVVAGVALTLVLMFAVAFGVDAAAVIDYPPNLIAPVAMVMAIAILGTALMRSDIEHRGEAVVDQLTGMLNRKALDYRKEELTQQSAISGQPVGMIVGDLDHFKHINDSSGHTEGDEVLKAVAATIREELRAFDLAYRIGGEEFLVLIPGSQMEDGAGRAASGEDLGQARRQRPRDHDELRRQRLAQRRHLRLRRGLRRRRRGALPGQARRPRPRSLGAQLGRQRAAGRAGPRAGTATPANIPGRADPAATESGAERWIDSSNRARPSTIPTAGLTIRPPASTPPGRARARAGASRRC